MYVGWNPERIIWVHTPSLDNRLPDVLFRDPLPPRPQNENTKKRLKHRS